MKNSYACFKLKDKFTVYTKQIITIPFCVNSFPQCEHLNTLLDALGRPRDFAYVWPLPVESSLFLSVASSSSLRRTSPSSETTKQKESPSITAHALQLQEHIHVQTRKCKFTNYNHRSIKLCFLRWSTWSAGSCFLGRPKDIENKT